MANDGFQMPQCTNFSNARWPIRVLHIGWPPF